MRRAVVISTPCSTDSATAASSSPSTPLMRRRFRRTYQLVSARMKATRRGTTVYRRYAAISVRTNATSDATAAATQWSMMLVEAAAAAASATHRPPVEDTSARRAAFCARKRTALAHGRNRSLTTLSTPASLKRSGSPCTTGESMRYRRSASAPYWRTMTMGSV